MNDPIFSLIESLSREVHDIHEEMRSGFARIEEVTRRHSTAITAGTFSIGGLTKAVERLESQMHDRDQQIADLRDRLRILEEKQGA
jgi:chromosome segregation ATPase